MGARTRGCRCLPGRLVACVGPQITSSRSAQRGSSIEWSRGYAGTELALWDGMCIGKHSLTLSRNLPERINAFVT